METESLVTSLPRPTSASLGDSSKDESTPEDHSIEISPTNNAQCTSQPQTSDNEITFVSPASQAATKPEELPATESATKCRPTLTQADAHFVSGMLFLKQVLERQGSGNQDMTQLASRISSKLLFLTLIPYLTQ
jgi:hypothetical protein